MFSSIPFLHDFLEATQQVGVPLAILGVMFWGIWQMISKIPSVASWLAQRATTAENREQTREQIAEKRVDDAIKDSRDQVQAMRLENANMQGRLDAANEANVGHIRVLSAMVEQQRSLMLQNQEVIRQTKTVIEKNSLLLGSMVDMFMDPAGKSRLQAAMDNLTGQLPRQS